MRNTKIKLVGVGLVILGMQVFAIDRPSGAISPSSSVLQGGNPVDINKLPALPSSEQDEPAAKSQKKTKLLLGILLGEMPAALKAQMNLDGFSGVLVEDIIRGGPADKAGIRKYDVITKIGEKPISKPIDIREALADTGGGDHVRIQLLRRMSVMQVDLVLDEVFALNEHDDTDASYPLREGPKNMIDKAIRAGRTPLPQDLCCGEDMEEFLDMFSDIMSRAQRFNHPMDTRERIEKMRSRILQMNAIPPNFQPSGVNGQLSENLMRSSSILRVDNQGSIEIKSDNQSGTRLIVKDLTGKIIFDGSYSTDDDKSKVPAAIKERINEMCINMRMR